MRTLTYMAAALLLLLAGCSGSRNQVVGTWADEKYGEAVMEFKPDGTVGFDTDTDKMMKRILATHPEHAERLKAEAPRFRQTAQAEKATWTTEKELTHVVYDFRGRPTDMYYKIVDGKLRPCDSTGANLGKLCFVRR